jgi:TRAP-type C4-dicarboxylate transport system permease small subunit
MNDKHPAEFPGQAFWLGAGALVVPLTLLLFLQWPLRELVQAWSRQANDLAQILFAVYVAVAITAASRANTHLAAHKSPVQPTRRQRVWRSTLILICVGPWSIFLLWAAAAPIARSVVGLERFSETFVPGYFVIKLALALLLILVLIEALDACRRAWPSD